MNLLTDWFIFFPFSQTSGAASYSKFVSREMSKAEALLKVCNQCLDVLVDFFPFPLNSKWYLKLEAKRTLKKLSDWKQLIKTGGSFGNGSN